MKHIVYVSQARRPMAPEELRALLDHSRARNAQNGITGLLVYRYSPDVERGNFLQVLEGPDPAIEDVWARIASDRRHHTIVTLDEAPQQERMFADWTMGFRDVAEGDLREAAGFADLGSDAFWERVQREALPGALDFLRGFYGA
ncbi:BLUF domain-containing protein [Roseivivax sp. CAU 1761]